MSACTHCGSDLRGEAKYCHTCGRLVAGADRPLESAALPTLSADAQETMVVTGKVRRPAPEPALETTAEAGVQPNDADPPAASSSRAASGSRALLVGAAALVLGVVLGAVGASVVGEGEEERAARYQVGECYLSQANGTVGADCDAPGAREVHAVIEVPGDDRFPGGAAVRARVASMCEAVAARRSFADPVELTPSEEEWRAGNHYAICASPA